jgi:AbrB family looped-hinge helix DNA binding protein
MIDQLSTAGAEMTTTSRQSRIIEGGKLIIPAPMRRALGLTTGDSVVVELEDGELRVRSLAKAVERAQAIVRRHVPAGTSLADELIADRRREAEHD